MSTEEEENFSIDILKGRKYTIQMSMSINDIMHTYGLVTFILIVTIMEGDGQHIISKMDQCYINHIFTTM